MSVDKEKLLEAKDFVDELIDYIFTYPDDDYMTTECLCRKLHKHGLIERKDGEWTCDVIEKADAERTEEYEEPIAGDSEDIPATDYCDDRLCVGNCGECAIASMCSLCGIFKPGRNR